jgi:hypothetical protein
MTTRMRFVITTLMVVAWCLAVGGAVLAASPSQAAIGPGNHSTGWSGKVFVAGATASPSLCPLPADAGNVLCDHFKLTVDVSQNYWSTHTGGISVSVHWTSSAKNFDLYLYDAGGSQVAASASPSGTSESLSLPRAAGTYEVRVVPKLVTNAGYSGSGSFSSQDTPPPPKPSPKPRPGGGGGGGGFGGGYGGYGGWGGYYNPNYAPGGAMYFGSGSDPGYSTSQRVYPLGQAGTPSQASAPVSQAAPAGLSNARLARLLWVLVPIGLMLFAAAGLAVFHGEEERDRRSMSVAMSRPVSAVPPPSLVGLKGSALILLYRGVAGSVRGLGRLGRWTWRKMRKAPPGTATGIAEQS